MKARDAQAAETTEQMLRDYKGQEPYPDDDEDLEEPWEADGWEPPYTDPDSDPSLPPWEEWVQRNDR